jgi:hypothetical protein
MGDLLNIYASGNYDVYKNKMFVARSAVGTDIATNADPTAYAATEGMMTVYNSATAAAKPNTVIIPAFLRLVPSVVTASGTTFDVKFSLDAKDRYTSGGTTLTGSPTLISTTKTALVSKATINFGDIVMPAASSEKVMEEVKVHAATAGQIIGDEYLFTWGDYGGSSALKSASAIQSYHWGLPLMYIERGCSMYLQLLVTSGATTGASFRVTFGYFEAQRGD